MQNAKLKLYLKVYQKPELGEPKSKFDRKSQKTEAENISPITQLKQHKKKEFKLTNDHALQSKNLSNSNFFL